MAGGRHTGALFELLQDACEVARVATAQPEGRLRQGANVDLVGRLAERCAAVGAEWRASGEPMTLLLRDFFAAKRGIIKRKPPEGHAHRGEPFSLSWEQFELVIAAVVGEAGQGLAAALGGDASAAPPRLPRFVRRFCHLFERCGCVRFATEMALTAATDDDAVKAAIDTFLPAEVAEAAGFHGDIGETPATLDPMARAEQSGASGADAAVLAELRGLGAEYIARHGVKFLVSAKGKSAGEMLAILKGRLGNATETELAHARAALWEITRKRLDDEPADRLQTDIEALMAKHAVVGASVCVSVGGGPDGAANAQSLVFGQAARSGRPVTPGCLFEIASLSKSVGTAFAIQYFAARGMPLDTPANAALEAAGSDFRLEHPEWGDRVTLAHLMSHSALSMHYVNGVPLGEPFPDVVDLLRGSAKHGYDPVVVVNPPGTTFQYSGGGFMVVQHIIESFEKAPIAAVTAPFLRELGVEGEMTFDPDPPGADIAHGYRDDGAEVAGTRLVFPAFAAGAYATPRAVCAFLRALQAAHEGKADGAVKPETAHVMLAGTDKGCQEFMGCLMGVGIFVGEAGRNRFAIHQGANDGFRSVFLYCFEGPDAGTGVVVAANGDNRAMFFIAETLQRVLRELDVGGINFEAFLAGDGVSVDSVPQEEIVNFGYKKLVFSAFQPRL